MKLVVTRARTDALAWSERLKDRFGIESIIVPLIESRMLPFPEIQLREGDALVFMSPRAVHYCPTDWVENCAKVRVFVQGPKTAKAVSLKFGTDSLCFPGRTSDDMGPWLQSEFGTSRPRVVVVRARRGRTVLRDFLISIGSEVIDIQAYESLYCRLSATEVRFLVPQLRSSLVCFFSPSAVKSWQHNNLPMPDYVASFGPVTSDAIRHQGWSVSLEAPSNEISDFEREIDKFLAEQNVSIECQK